MTTTDRRQGVNAGQAIKVPCRVATTAAITLSGTQTIDGVAVVAGDRVLVKNQASSVDNGIYVVDSSAWDRALDFDGTLDVVTGTLVFVYSGSTNLGWWYVSTVDAQIVLGTDVVDFAQASTSLAVVSAFMQTMIDDTSARTARQTLLTHKKGSDVASAGTIDLDTTTGDIVDVTGTTTITAITLSEGEERTVRFTAALTLTDGASLVLPGDASITTVAGDVAVFRGYAAGVVRCTSYQKIDGGAPRGSWILLSSQTASASATIDVIAPGGLVTTYDQYMIVFNAVKPATDDVYLGLRIGTGVGPTYQTANYQYAARFSGPGGGADIGSASDDRIILSRTGAAQGVGSASGELINGIVYFELPNATDYLPFRVESSYMRSDAAIIDFRCSGVYGGGAAIVTGIRFLFSSGNIASGTFRLYGLRK